MSPITVLRRELFPAPTEPITQTNSPFLIFRLRLFKMKSSFTSAAAVSGEAASSSCLQLSSLLPLTFFVFFFLLSVSSSSFSKPQWKEPSLISTAEGPSPFSIRLWSISSQRRKSQILYMETRKLKAALTKEGRLLIGPCKILNMFRIKKASPNSI